MPSYLVTMLAYTVMTVFLLYLVIANTLRSSSRWDQFLAVLVIVPLAMRVLSLK